MDGKPLANAVVFFQPIAAQATDAEAGGVGSTGKTDSEGRFTLEASTDKPTPGALVGKHKVIIGNAQSAKDAINMESDSVNPTGKELPKLPKDTIPAKYNTETELTFEVPPGGTDQANFDLKSK